MASSMLQLLFNAADVIVVGRFAGRNPLAAVGSTTSLINLLVALFVGALRGLQCGGGPESGGSGTTWWAARSTPHSDGPWSAAQSWRCSASFAARQPSGVDVFPLM